MDLLMNYNISNNCSFNLTCGGTGTSSSTSSSSGSSILNVPFYIVFISAIFYIITFLAGCFGNALVIFVVIRNKFLQHNTNYCLVNLSIADLLLLCVCMPSAFVELFSEEVWYFGYIVCKITYWLENTVVNASVLTISSICVERYLAITRPLIVKRISKSILTAVISSIWILSISAAIPFMILTSYHEAYHRKYNKIVYICHTEFKNSWQRGYLFAMFVLFYITPCILLFFQYGRIIHVIQNTHTCKLNTSSSPDTLIERTEHNIETNSECYSMNKISSIKNSHYQQQQQQLATTTEPFLQSSSPKIRTKAKTTVINSSLKSKCSVVRMRPPNKNHKQTTKMLFVMMILFFVCILPYRIFSIWAVFAVRADFEKLGIENFYLILAISRIMFYLNSAINPILYHILSTKFQTAFKRSIYCCKRRSTPQQQLKPCLKK